MRLLSLYIGQYKSLESFSYDFREYTTGGVDIDGIDPLCFVGLNGSGKSNIIEALSEIFCFLDLVCLDYGETPKWAAQSPFTFRLDYSLKINKKGHKVSVEAVKGNPPFLVVDDAEESISLPDEMVNWLPKRVLGYSSGHNETISFPYLRNQGFYADEITKSALVGEGKTFVPHTKTLLMDYESNVLILLANFLFCPPAKKKIFQEHLRIKDVSSFRLVIDFSRKRGVDIKRTLEIEETIEKLKAVALIHEQVSQSRLVLDFIVGSATRKAFKSYFKGGVDFYTRLYKLSLLNALQLSGAERDFYTKKPKVDALLEKPPAVPKQDKTFAVDQLKLVLSKPNREIDYVGISDGEHQFIHIIGSAMLFEEDNCLFLFDEPESHFNPSWRAKFIDILSTVVGNRAQDFVISTHSPYVVSACYSRNVVKFQRDGENIKYGSPTRETFGGTFERLLKDLFGLSSSIAEHSSNRLAEVIESGDLEAMELVAAEYAESPEKRKLYEIMLRLEEQSGDSE